MSYVTNVIISAGFITDEVRVQIENFGWSFGDRSWTVGHLHDIRETDGTHHSVGNLFSVGLNYFDEEKFREFLDTIDWYSPESVIVIIRSEGWDECGPNKQDVWRPKCFRDSEADQKETA